jgi:hypothetical protein
MRASEIIQQIGVKSENASLKTRATKPIIELRLSLWGWMGLDARGR